MSRSTKDCIVFTLLGVLGIVASIMLGDYMLKNPESAVVSTDGAYMTIVQQTLPIAICAVMLQFFTLAIGVKVEEFNVLIVAGVYTLILGIAVLIIFANQGVFNNFNFGMFIATLIGLFLIAVISFLIALPMQLFIWLYNIIPFTIIPTILYIGVTVALFSFGAAVLIAFPWTIAVLIGATIVITLVVYGIMESQYDSSGSGLNIFIITFKK